MNKGRYVVIHDWMTHLGLTDSEVLILALIYGTCRACGTFRGGVPEVLKWTCLKRRKVMSVTKLFKESGIMTVKGGARPEYFIAEGIQANTDSIMHTIAQLNVQTRAQFKGYNKGNIGVISKKEKEKRYTLDDYEHDLMMHSVAPEFYPMPDKSRIYNGPKTQQ